MQQHSINLSNPPILVKCRRTQQKKSNLERIQRNFHEPLGMKQRKFAKKDETSNCGTLEMTRVDVENAENQVLLRNPISCPTSLKVVQYVVQT